MDRLRANLKAAGIPVTEEDLERIEADGYLERVADTRELLAAADARGTPDFLALWGPEAEAGLHEEARSGAEEARSGAGANARDDREDARDRVDTRGADEGVPRGRDGLPATIVAVAELLRRGEISPVELAERALARIEERDESLNLFQSVLSGRAMEAARRAEQEIRSGRYRGPLHGVPIAAKDLLEMTGTVTTAGSKVRAEHRSTVDAAAIERLEAAGAVVVGKTRLSEFAYWPGSTNPHYGPTRNPRNPDRDAGGSSSGSAAAVADGVVYGALGTDTGGSIRIPAALCGVLGLKPTFGRVSLFGCVPLAWSLDHLGPITRTAEDAGLMLEALSGSDARDPRTRHGADVRWTPVKVGSGRGTQRGPARGADLHGLRIGVMNGDGSAEPMGSGASVAAWRESNQALSAAGASLIEVDMSEMHVLWRVSALMLGVEASAYHADTLRARYGEYGKFCRGRLVGAFAYGFDDLMRAQRVRRRIRLKWERLFEHVDVLSTPCQPDVAPTLGMAASTRYTNPFNALGWPAVSVPFGAGDDGLPLGTQLVARPWDDVRLLRIASGLEAEAPHG